MKKEMLLAAMLLSSLLLGGCSIGSADSEETISTQDFSSLHEQLDSIQSNVKQYMAVPPASDYMIATSNEITYTFTELESDLLIQLENVSKDSYKNIDILMVFYDADNNMLYSSTQYLENILTGNTYTTKMSYPTDQNGANAAYDHYDIQIKALPYKFPVEDFSEKVEVISNKGTDGYVIAKFTNKSDQVLTTINSYILYYDESGNIIGCEQGNVYDLLPDSYDVTSYSLPYGLDYIPLEYADYKIFITSAINIDSALTNLPRGMEE